MKYFGKVGFVRPKETAPGVYEEEEIIRPYFGDVINRTFQWENSDNLNDNINVRSEISIVADMFAYDNFPHIRFVEYMGANWKVTSMRDERPRIVLSIGGLWNGK